MGKAVKGGRTRGAGVASREPHELIRRYLDANGGLVTVLTEDITTSWRLPELTDDDRRRIESLLSRVGVHTEPPMSEVEDGDLVTLFVPGHELGGDAAGPTTPPPELAAPTARADRGTVSAPPVTRAARSLRPAPFARRRAAPARPRAWSRGAAAGQAARAWLARPVAVLAPLAARGRLAPVLVALALGLAAGGAAYAVGAGGGENLDAARLDGQRTGQSAGSARGARSGARAGFREGRRQGYRQTYRRSFVNACRKSVEAADTTITPEEACK
jgi:hypothetical protein